MSTRKRRERKLAYEVAVTFVANSFLYEASPNAPKEERLAAVIKDRQALTEAYMRAGAKLQALYDAVDAANS